MYSYTYIYVYIYRSVWPSIKFSPGDSIRFIRGEFFSYVVVPETPAPFPV